jgi:hypothetical protein
MVTGGSREWACLDLNQGPLPYQGSALTELSYRPVAGKGDDSDAPAMSARRKRCLDRQWDDPIS